MSEELEKLQRLGVKKIYDDTHIPMHHIQAILHSSFDGFNKVQFLGFISILEREYHCKLSELKALAQEHFDEKKARLSDDGVLSVPVKKTTKLLQYLLVLIVIVGATLFINYFVLDQKQESTSVVDDSLIQDVQKNIIEQNRTLVIDTNDSDENNETNISSIIVEEVNTTSLFSTPESFKIVPRSKVWLGYIDIQKNHKYQKTLSDAINLDANKSWLLFFGHGYIDMYVDGVVQKFDSRNKIRFLYKDGILQAISSAEFKSLNRGNRW